MPQDSARIPILHARRIIVKVGSAVLAPGGELSQDAVDGLADQIAKQKRKGRQIALVSSGAVASGFRQLGLETPPKSIRLKQAAAAIGQQRLMAAWAQGFAKSRNQVAQVLLTAEDFDHRSRFLNARHTLETLLEHGVVPVINENDSVSFDEIKLGDNDRLSALAASMLRADLLVMLSSAPGLLAGRQVVPVVENLRSAREHVRPDKSGVGTGGMTTKLDAAEVALRVGIPAVIAPGNLDGVLGRLLEGESVGTLFQGRKRGSEDSPDARRRWLGLSARPRGAILVDAGAAAALQRRGASLLSPGIVSVEGDFERGAIIEIRHERSCIARGLTAYSAAEIDKFRGRKAGEIGKLLGYVLSDEVVHRDDLLLTEDGA
ncbi:MAG: glutamate 5-kinase [Phycisphaerales bacterium]|nr:glutamate 5-kinase [Planctomycetota bacterium]